MKAAALAFTALLGAVFLGDQFGLEVLAGGALIAGAVILLQRQGANTATAFDRTERPE